MAVSIYNKWNNIEKSG